VSLAAALLMGCAGIISVEYVLQVLRKVVLCAASKAPQRIITLRKPA
jgi:hypothetical protein